MLDVISLEAPREGRSPFRYPGGKAFMVKDLAERIRQSASPIDSYAEPFAGGAGAAIQLLAADEIDDIYLNDADVRIYSAWSAMLTEGQRFIDKIDETPLSIEVWKQMREKVLRPNSAESLFELGFATFFVNRTSRSGILIGSGPIGGYAQDGDWNLASRYYKETMKARINWLSKNAKRIKLSHKDALSFIRSFTASRARKTFFFIDPPYVGMGSRLYFNSMNENSHVALANLIKRKKSLNNWLVTYDDTLLIWECYKFARVSPASIRYSLQAKKTASELVIEPAHNLV